MGLCPWAMTFTSVSCLSPSSEKAKGAEVGEVGEMSFPRKALIKPFLLESSLWWQKLGACFTMVIPPSVSQSHEGIYFDSSS